MAAPGITGHRFKSLWPLLLPALLIAAKGLGGFAYAFSTAKYSDLVITHYPNALFLKMSISQFGAVPLWSSSILSGYPFAGNPLSGLFYPPGWLALLFPLPLGFNLTVIVHMLLGGLGMYLFAIAIGRTHHAALFAGLAYELLPKTFAHFGAGHLTMVYAIYLTPWLLLAAARSWKNGGAFWLRQPGLILGLIILADPRWAAYAGLLWVAFSLAGDLRARGAKLIFIFKQAVLAVTLGAPLLLPLLEYTQLSTRAHLLAAESSTYSLPLSALLGLFAPQFSGFHEWILYPGIILALLAIAGACLQSKQRLQWFWIGTVVGAILFALGENVPGLRQLLQLPGVSLLRVPTRVLPIAYIAILVLAAEALDALLRPPFPHNTLRRLRLAMTAVLALELGLVLGGWLVTEQPLIPFLWGFLISLSFFLLLFVFMGKRIEVQRFWTLVVTLMLIDLAVMDSTLYSMRAKELVQAEGKEVASYLASQPGIFRVYSPSYSIPQQTASDYGLQLADGGDPLQLQSYVSFMEEATGVSAFGYSVTLPTFASGEPSTDNADAVLEIGRLARLNVKYVAAEFEINIPGLELIDQFGTTTLYRLVDYLPRAYIEGDAEKEAIITSWTPNRIEVDVEGPGRLVLSELMYPGWVASVNGNPVALVSFQELFRSVELESGRHKVVFEFRPLSVYYGLVVCLLVVSTLIWRSSSEKKKGTS